MICERTGAIANLEQYNENVRCDAFRVGGALLLRVNNKSRGIKSDIIHYTVHDVGVWWDQDYPMGLLISENFKFHGYEGKRLVHVFRFEDWFEDKQENADCVFQYLIFEPSRIVFMDSYAPAHEETLRMKYPDRIIHPPMLRRSRGEVRLAQSEATELANEWPEVWERLGREFTLQIRR